jgi:hypothetical protein
MIGNSLRYCFFVILLFSAHNERQMTSLNEIIDVTKDAGKADFFFDRNFHFGELGMRENPIFPFRFNYTAGNSNITFCHIPVVTCWALKSKASFTFFIILTSSENISYAISKQFGKVVASTETEVNFKPNNSSYHWESSEFNISLRKFHNSSGNVKYGNCSIVILGNHNVNDLFVLAP